MPEQEMIFLGEQMSYDRTPELFSSVKCQKRAQITREAETCDLPQLV